MRTNEKEELEKCIKGAKLYKGRYLIALYDKDDDIRDIVDNVVQLANNMNIDVNTQEFKTLKSRISYCVKKREPHSRYFNYRGVSVRPFLIDTQAEVDEEVLL